MMNMTKIGYEYWVTRDYGGDGKALSISKSVLGTFMYELFKMGGGVHQTFAMGKSPRSFIQMSIFIPAGKKEELERLSGITLEKNRTLSI